MSSWKGKSRGGLTGHRIFIGILRNAGLPSAYLLLRFVALYFFLFNPRSFRIIRSFYSKRFGYGFFRSVKAVYTNYYVFGQVLLDKVAVMAGMKTKFSYDFDGEEHLRAMAGAGKGGLLISAHTGNFEMAGFMLERLRTSVSIIIFDEEYEKIKEYLSTVTTRTYSVIPVKKNDNSHIFAINKALGEGQIVCIHGDRFLPGSKSVLCDFLGEEALFPAGPFYMSMKFSVPVSFVFAMKERKYHYHFYATPPRLYSQQSTQALRDETIRSVVSDYVKEFEKMVRKYPAQWFNYYDFWEKKYK